MFYKKWNKIKIFKNNIIKIIYLKSTIRQVHGHRELVAGEEAVSVDVGQVPDLAQLRCWQLWSHHDLPNLQQRNEKSLWHGKNDTTTCMQCKPKCKKDF